ncbi:hypothetical protein BDN72DRAFT_893093 [Pluteus cervinus]|uniref:Uncharacterized protein n=1 Tax=Pluteus cervinus TaxID=181527 RepID=A0ACD3B8R2_9AGAR|nr:hypothetical protein BDN72DRAFT_893093 [Pluteus cervinus]
MPRETTIPDYFSRAGRTAKKKENSRPSPPTKRKYESATIAPEIADPEDTPRPKKARGVEPGPSSLSRTSFATPVKPLKAFESITNISDEHMTQDSRSSSPGLPPVSEILASSSRKRKEGTFSSEKEVIDMTMDVDPVEETNNLSVERDTAEQHKRALIARTSLQTPPPTERPSKRRENAKTAEYIASSSRPAFDLAAPSFPSLRRIPTRRSSFSDATASQALATNGSAPRSQDDLALGIRPGSSQKDISRMPEDNDDENDPFAGPPSPQPSVPSSQPEDRSTSVSPLRPRASTFKVPDFPLKGRPIFPRPTEYHFGSNEVPSSQTQLIFPGPPTPQRQRIYKLPMHASTTIIDDLEGISQDIVQSSQSQIEREITMLDDPAIFLPKHTISPFTKPNDGDAIMDPPSFPPSQEPLPSSQEGQHIIRPSTNQPTPRTRSEEIFGFPEADQDLNELFVQHDSQDDVEIPPVRARSHSGSATESDSESDVRSFRPMRYVPPKPPSTQTQTQPQPVVPEVTIPDLESQDYHNGISQPSYSQGTSYASLPDVVKNFRDMFEGGSSCPDYSQIG